MNVILCAYNWVGCKALDLLLKREANVYVYTHESPYYINSVVDYCKKLNIPFSTEKISYSNLPFEKVDFIASIYYRYIIDNAIIEFSNGKIFNLHPSLLPKYRGCSSITWAMTNGEVETGFTYHYITKGVDEGNVIVQKPIFIEDFDTQYSIYQRNMYESIKYFNEVVDLVLTDYKGVSQIGEATYFKRGCPHNGIIDEEWELNKVERFIRAMIYPPLPLAKYKNNDVSNLENFVTLKESIDALEKKTNYDFSI